MGLSGKAERRHEFLQAHPHCYFCGEAASTIDHVPSRQLFAGRIGPEGYEFPACAVCNHGAGQLEQVAAYFRYMCDFDGYPSNVEKRDALLQGVLNNNPEAVPTPVTDDRERREILARMGLMPWLGEKFFPTVGVVAITPSGRRAFALFARRLACALYYKHRGAVAPRDHYITALQMPSLASPDRVDAVNMWYAEHWDEAVFPRRGKTDLSGQFCYSWRAYGQSGFGALVDVGGAFTIKLFVAPPGNPNAEAHSCSAAHEADFTLPPTDAIWLL